MVATQVNQLWRSIQDFITQNDHQVIGSRYGYIYIYIYIYLGIVWFLQKQVIDSILSGNVKQHVINANDLCFKVCAYVLCV